MDAKQFVDDAQAEAHDNAEIARLASLPLLEYGRARTAAADKLKISASWLDKLVTLERKKPQPDDKDEALLDPHWAVQPCDEPVDGVALLQDIAERVRTHVVMTEYQAAIVALWVVMSWVHDRAAVHSPILMVTSAEQDSGKS